MTGRSATARAAALLSVTDRTLVMGVVNVTPDSFSDGGEWFETKAAVRHGRELLAAGADIVDVGGESTRPGAERPSVQEELRRVVPVVEALAVDGAVVSVDTMRADVARAAANAGAAIVNDVSGGLSDPEMVPWVAAERRPFIAMHWRGHSTEMQSRADYGDVVQDVIRELAERRDALLDAGVEPEALVLDPGLGFAKHAEHNWALLAALPDLHELGHPILLGASRKTFLGRLGATDGQPPRPAFERDPETAATSVMAAMAGLWCVRVHDVAATVRALAVVQAAAAAADLADAADAPDPADGADAADAADAPDPADAAG